MLREYFAQLHTRQADGLGERGRCRRKHRPRRARTQREAGHCMAPGLARKFRWDSKVPALFLPGCLKVGHHRERHGDHLDREVPGQPQRKQMLAEGPLPGPAPELGAEVWGKRAKRTRPSGRHPRVRIPSRCGRRPGRGGYGSWGSRHRRARRGPGRRPRPRGHRGGSAGPGGAGRVRAEGGED